MKILKKLYKRLYSTKAQVARASLAADFQKAFRAVLTLVLLSSLPYHWVVPMAAATGVTVPAILFSVSPAATFTLVALAIFLRVVQFALEYNLKPKSSNSTSVN